MEVKLRLVKRGNDKLATVKAIKFCTGLGLKESKDFIDAFDGPNGAIVQTLDILDFEVFRDCLSKLDYEFLVGDIQRERREKFIELGLGDDMDTMELLAEKLSEKMFKDMNSRDDKRVFPVIRDNIFEILFDIEDPIIVRKMLDKLKKKE